MAARGQSVEYVRVRVDGRFDFSSESFLYMPERQGPGYHLYTHLETTERQRVIVNRGFIPEASKAQAARAESLVAGTTTVTGLLRTPQSPGAFTPPSEPAKRLFFYPDHEGMLAVAPLPAETRQAAVPFFIDADAAPGTHDYPRGGVTRLELPNRHLEYALTWWGLALTLVVVYAVFARSRLTGVTTAR
jgi:surfeit locus 1 family protein